MSRKSFLVLTNVCLVLALAFSLIPQPWPTMATVSQFVVAACAIAVVCSFVCFQNNSQENPVQEHDAQEDSKRADVDTGVIGTALSATLRAKTSAEMQELPQYAEITARMQRAILDQTAALTEVRGIVGMRPSTFRNLALGRRMASKNEALLTNYLNFVLNVERSASRRIGRSLPGPKAPEVVTFGTLTLEVKDDEVVIQTAFPKRPIAETSLPPSPDHESIKEEDHPPRVYH